jgi:O-antigen/teichoic acid export membrane protein
MEFLRSVMWIAAGRWVYNLLTLISFAVIVARVDPADYGAYAIAMTFLILSEVYSTDVTEHAIVRHRGSDSDAAAAGRLVAGIGAVVIGASSALSGILAQAIGYELLAQLCWAIAGLAILQAASGLGRGQLLRAGRVQSFAATVSIANLIGVVSGLAAIFSGLGIWSLVCQQIAINLTAAIVTRAPILPNSADTIEAPREQIEYALLGLGSAALNVMTNRIDVILAAAFFGQGGAGHLGLAKRLIQILQDLVSSSFDKALVSFLSRSRGAAGDIYMIAVAGQAILILPAFAGFALVSGSLVPALFGQSWILAASLVPAMAIGGVFRSAVAIERAQQVYDGEIARIFAVRVFELAVSWLILLPLAPFGLFWLGVGFSLRYALSYYLVLRSRLRSAQETRRHLTNTARTISAPLRATLVMAAILVLIHAGPSDPGIASLLIEILLGSAVYLAAMWLMRRSWLPIFRATKP